MKRGREAEAPIESPDSADLHDGPALDGQALDGQALEVVGERQRRVSMTLVGWLAAIIVVIALFGMAAFHAVIVQGQGRLDDIEAQLTAERAKTEQLRLTLAELEAPDRIVAEAQSRLGMVEPTNVIYLAPEGSQAGPAEGAPDQGAGGQ